MLKHYALPTIREDQFVCFPELVGVYADYPAHSALRREGEFPHFNLHLVTQGRGYVELDGKTHELRSGDAFFFSPGQRQSYYSSQDEPWEVYWVHFYGDKMREFLLGKGFYATNLWMLNAWDRLREAFERLIDEAGQHKLLHPAQLSALTYAVVTEFASQAVPLTPRKERSSSDTVLGLLYELQERACEPFELQLWADKAGVSPYYFCKLFRKLTQRTPMEFVALCRIRQAKQLLIEQRSLSVASVAGQCGYPSVSYFIQRFKRQEGMTPAEFRNSV